MNTNDLPPNENANKKNGNKEENKPKDDIPTTQVDDPEQYSSKAVEIAETGGINTINAVITNEQIEKTLTDEMEITIDGNENTSVKNNADFLE